MRVSGYRTAEFVQPRHQPGDAEHRRGDPRSPATGRGYRSSLARANCSCMNISSGAAQRVALFGEDEAAGMAVEQRHRAPAPAR